MWINLIGSLDVPFLHQIQIMSIFAKEKTYQMFVQNPMLLHLSYQIFDAVTKELYKDHYLVKILLNFVLDTQHW